MSEAFHLLDVRKAYKGFRLHIGELALPRGYVMGVVGRNGAGKSTAIKIMLNLIYPDAGQVEVLGLRQPGDEMEIKRRIGYVSEESSLYEDMSISWLAGLVQRYYPTWDEQLYRHYLNKFSLDPQAKIRELSKGTKVRLALTLALSHRPELLILDEPTSGIDPVARHELLAEIANIIRDEQRSVVFSSHITQDVEQLADYVTIIDRGQVVEKADKESLFDRWRRITGAFAVGADRLRIAAMFRSFRSDACSFVGVTDSFSQGWLKQLEGTGASNIKSASIGLDEILVVIANGQE